MSWTPWIIARRECDARISETFVDANKLLKRMLSLRNHHFTLRGEFFDIATNARIREIADDRWSWSSEQYLWVKPENIKGGIDIEIDQIDENVRGYISRNMMARNADLNAYAEMMHRATNGVRYTLRLSFFQPRVMYPALWALAAALATAADGYLYTTDADWLAPMVPLSSAALRGLLVNEKHRIQIGFQKDVDAAIQEIRGTI